MNPGLAVTIQRMRWFLGVFFLAAGLFLSLGCVIAEFRGRLPHGLAIGASACLAAGAALLVNL